MSWNWESFVFALVAFGILYWLLSKYAFGPLLATMEERRKLIADQMNSADASRVQAEQMLEEQKQVIQEARKEAYQMIEQAKLTSSKQAEEIVDKAKSEADRVKEEAVREIESEKNKAVAALRGQVSAMSVMIASKIIEKQVDEKSQEELVNHYLNEVGGSK
ncbi:ATP synthase F0 subunit B [Paenibacillus chitinolyticus]|uniref:ATP synthase subunit b n=1 Tax=Paenibacillus chitinolyticus TaxID=79263 RepID=A0A410WQA2_9BACL|nr:MULTISPECIES: F0F1 ATP synthase subunit B [Paenibacillus]MCY9591744.1 F0F1 ATP synthase subunit B [Paenibacillus chitinolyticus]MCY9596103.1 F0F1 ATP synthase subunit B [Paenibacillus chitinolyticus]QAV16609.1 ATP synthase F0 subunit B [Paenibacillus chitinolyticus]SEG62470.1 F-type H+-transporting ATPase subunit b [Paenibacillus sp. UNC499MF]